MAMRDMLRKVGGSPGATPSRTPNPLDEADRLALLDSIETEGLCWFWVSDANHRLTYISPSAAAKFGRERDLSGIAVSELFEIKEGGGSEAETWPLSFLLATHARFDDRLVRLADDDDAAFWKLAGRPHFGDDGVFLGFRGSAREAIDEPSCQHEQGTPPQPVLLTGIGNRRHLEDRLDGIVPRLLASRRSCAIILLDLDRFRRVNDMLGHPAGDHLLSEVAQRLQETVPPSAEIDRLGGDQFQIILPDRDDRGDLGELADSIIQIVSQPYWHCEQRVEIGASIGIAIAPYDGLAPRELAVSADLALTAAKGGGHGQYRFYGSDLADKDINHHELGELLRKALAEDAVEMHYQPIVRASGNRVIGFEALMRWDHAKLGQISPATFLRVAEDSNLLDELGQWALSRACGDARDWPEDIGVSVNISFAEFFSGNLPGSVASALKSSGIRPARLELEITESIFLGDPAAIERLFAELKELGVRLALDDFGTGFSCLSMLREAPFDTIKIDKSFVRDCRESGSFNAAIITAIISLAQSLGLRTIAEGVEASDELDLVLDRGVDLIQGFIFARAMPQDVVLEKFASGDFVYEPVGPLHQRLERRVALRRIGVIHDNFRYDAILRNLSRSGAMIEGLLDVPVGTDLVIDLGGGQLAVATVRRSQDATQGVEFETPLVSDGASGLCTRHRVSPYLLAEVGLPLASLDSGIQTPMAGAPKGRRRFMQVDVFSGSSRAA